MSICSKSCDGCDYLSRNSSGKNGVRRTCDYILITGHRRGCPAGSRCTKKRVGGVVVKGIAADIREDVSRQMLQRRLDAENEKRHFETLKRWTQLSDEQLMRVARKHRYYQEHKGRAAELKRIHREERRNAEKA